MKIRHHNGLLVASLSVAIGSHSEMISAQEVTPIQMTFVCTVDGSMLP